jgi:ATP-dependent Clp protease adaptor protein ClpS
MAADLEQARESMEKTVVRTRRAAKEQGETKKIPPYAVVLHNDDINTFEFVVCVLQKVFAYDLPKAFMLTLEAHETGRSIVWTGSLEVAELKADQILSCGADPSAADRGSQPLRVSIEAQ